jgi:hypothetical protein
MGSGEEGFSLFVVREAHGSLAPFSIKRSPVGWGGLLELETLILSLGKQCPPLRVLRKVQNVNYRKAYKILLVFRCKRSALKLISLNDNSHV